MVAVILAKLTQRVSSVKRLGEEGIFFSNVKCVLFIYLLMFPKCGVFNLLEIRNSSESPADLPGKPQTCPSLSVSCARAAVWL